MKIKDILKRKHYLSMPLSKLQSPKFVIEACKTSESTNEIESVLKSWKSLNLDEDFALVEVSKILGDYLENCSDSNAHKLVHIVNEEFIPSAKDLNKCKNLFNKNINNDHFTHHLNEGFDLNFSCDRVLKNQVSLNKLGFDKIIKESSITDDTDKEICIENLCDFINNLKVKNSVKYNLALENILYSTNQIYNKKDILESVTSYFFSKNDLSENDIDRMQSVLIETPLYEDVDKSNVLYVFELSRSDLDQSDFGLPDQKKYPMPDQKHVLSAIKFFNYVSSDDEKTLANNIKKKIKKFKLKNIHIGDNNRFKKYYNESVTEEIKKCPFCETTGAKSKIINHIKNNHKDKLKKSNESIESLLEKASKVKCPFCSGLYEATSIKSHIDKDHKDKAHSKLAEAVIKKALNENHSNYSSNADPGIGTENNDGDEDSIKDPSPSTIDTDEENKENDTQTTISADSSKGVNSKKKNLTTESAKKMINNIKGPKKEIKNMINSFSITKDKSAKGLKNLIEKIFTKSPESIIEEVPDVLGVIRRVLILSTVALSGPIGPIIAIVGMFTNKLIELKLRRPQMDRVVKKYKKESDKLDRMILNANNEKKKTALKEMKKKIDSDIDKLERYQDNLYSEKELDKRFEQEYSEATDLIGDNKEAYISISDFMNLYHKKMITEVYRVINALQVILESNPKFNKLIDNPALSISSPQYFHTFEMPDVNIIDKFINYGKATVKIAKFFPLKYAKTYMLNGDFSVEIKTILNQLCDYLQDLTDIGYTIYFDGSDDLYYIMMELSYHIIGVPKESACLIEQCEAIDGIDEQMTSLLNGKIDKFLENCHYAINEDTVEDISTLLEECADFLITKEEATNVLESFFSSIKDKIDFNASKLKSFIKKAIDKIKKKPVQENTYVNNVLEYDKLYNLNEAIDSVLELSIKNNVKMAALNLKNKAALMKDKETNISKKLDDSLERIDDNLRKQTSNNAREKIVKGRVLPKASKLIKYGIATGVAYAVNPALAAIGVIGGIGVSKIGSKKEKQYILDEIDIQLKLVERKIQLAENNNDMKSLEELFKIEKKLKRERQRIFYNMKAMYPVSAN